MAPQTDLPAVWDSYQNVVQNLRDKGLTKASPSPRTTRTARGSATRRVDDQPLLLEGSGYSDYKGYEDEVQALQDQARAMERISEALEELKEAPDHRHYGQVG
jgi:hypothetical protein